MSVRVRFAPSPTGHLHIGGARTALYNYLFAKAHKGTCVLRIEDTDEERSQKDFEKEQISDLAWLGITFDEGPNNPGEYGPYRQSERKEIYQERATHLLNEGKAYRCFCSAEELEKKKEIANEKNLPPHYDGTCKALSADQLKQNLDSNKPFVLRFKVPGKEASIKDGIRGEIKFPADMVGDFVIQRSNGMPVYNFCCVVDDALMKITHVIRGEDHLNNTLRQQLVYEAFGYEVPVFVHCSLLIGQDRQKLSKRHGATSLQHYIKDDYQAEAINNYLVLLGWSHPEEKDVFTLEEIVPHFIDIKRFSKASAIYDMDKLKYINSEHLKKMPISELKVLCEKHLDKGHQYFAQSDSWKEESLALFQNYLDFSKSFGSLVDNLFKTQFELGEEEKEIQSWETTGQIKEYLKVQVQQFSGDFISLDQIDEWMNHLKKELKIKGKPLFKGARFVLTGKGEGADLKTSVKLTPVSVLKERF